MIYIKNQLEMASVSYKYYFKITKDLYPIKAKNIL